MMLRVWAPNARQVELEIEDQRIVMTLDDYSLVDRRESARDPRSKLFVHR